MSAISKKALLKSMGSQGHMLTENDIKEELSYAYLHAIACRAGYSVDRPFKDRDSIDAQVSARGFLGNSLLSSPKVEFQLKATSVGKTSGNVLKYRIPVKNYDELRLRTMVPRILLVLKLPDQEQEWLVHQPEALIAKTCAFWFSLIDAEKSPNKSKVTLDIPMSQTFDEEQLIGFLVKASMREDITNGV